MKLLTISSLILFICLCASTSSADIYSWVDENGITHFTNYSPPPTAKLVIKDIPFSRRTVPEKETVEDDLLGKEPEIAQDLEVDRIHAKREKAEVLEKEPDSSESYDPNVSGSDGPKNSYVSEYPPGFHNRPYYPELNLIKHHPNYHYRYHLDKPYAKKHHSAFRHKGHNNKPTIWDRNPRSHKKRVFGWQPPKAKGRPSAHYFAFGGGHYRGTSITAKGRFGGRGSAFGGKGRFGGGRGGR